MERDIWQAKVRAATPNEEIQGPLRKVLYDLIDYLGELEARVDALEGRDPGDE